MDHDRLVELLKRTDLNAWVTARLAVEHPWDGIDRLGDGKCPTDDECQADLAREWGRLAPIHGPRLPPTDEQVERRAVLHARRRSRLVSLTAGSTSPSRFPPDPGSTVR